MASFSLTSRLLRQLSETPYYHRFGYIESLRGSLIEVSELYQWGVIGSLCLLIDRTGNKIQGEIIGFDHQKTYIMAYGRSEGLGPGCRVYLKAGQPLVYPCHSWLGRIVNGLGQPLDHAGTLQYGDQPYNIFAPPLPSHDRRLLEETLDVGIRAINTFVTLCKGQRIGIFAGSGVGKSVLLSQLAKFTQADVIVIGLIGERGREVREFIDKNLGPCGLKKSVIVVATSDEPALMRRRAAHMTLTVAEYFRDQGLNVLCLMDSVTRFAMALREIGLALGEMPASRGYTPSVFAELPRLLERAGPGLLNSPHLGDITGIFTVLVDGDDHNEPIADTVRGILDGHIVLDRSIAERGRFPAINILKSVSRTLPDCQYPHEWSLVQKAKQLLANYEDMVDMIRLGAYRPGSSPAVDEAIEYQPTLESFLSQGKEQASSHEEGFVLLKDILNLPDAHEQA